MCALASSAECKAVARKLNHLVQFRRAVLVDDGFSDAPEFADHGAPVWADRSDVSDAERLSSGGITASLVSRFTIYSDAFAVDISARDVLVCDGVTYDISGIKRVRDRHDFFEITAAGRVD